MSRSLTLILAFLAFLAEPLMAVTPSSSQLFARHKGFMVFLNWHFQQKAPMIVTKHFKKVSTEGQWQQYQGHYGAFDHIQIGLCQGKITDVLAITTAMPGGIDGFLKIWLEDRLYKMVKTTSDQPNQSSFYISASTNELPCQKPRVALAKAITGNDPNKRLGKNDAGQSPLESHRAL